MRPPACEKIRINTGMRDARPPYPYMTYNTGKIAISSLQGAARGAILGSSAAVFGGLWLDGSAIIKTPVFPFLVIPAAVVTTVSLPVVLKSAAIGAAIGALVSGGVEVMRQHGEAKVARAARPALATRRKPSRKTRKISPERAPRKRHVNA